MTLNKIREFALCIRPGAASLPSCPPKFSLAGIILSLRYSDADRLAVLYKRRKTKASGFG